jgi:hypothetical protein
MGADEATGAGDYVITCRGRIPADARLEFEGWTVSEAVEGSVLAAERHVDQPALHGALDRLSRLGLAVLEVRRMPGAPGP